MMIFLVWFGFVWLKVAVVAIVAVIVDLWQHFPPYLVMCFWDRAMAYSATTVLPAEVWAAINTSSPFSKWTIACVNDSTWDNPINTAQTQVAHSGKVHHHHHHRRSSSSSSSSSNVRVWRWATFEVVHFQWLATYIFSPLIRPPSYSYRASKCVHLNVNFCSSTPFLSSSIFFLENVHSTIHDRGRRSDPTLLRVSESCPIRRAKCEPDWVWAGGNCPPKTRRRSFRPTRSTSASVPTDWPRCWCPQRADRRKFRKPGRHPWPLQWQLATWASVEWKQSSCAQATPY